jgi:hypothetical protein
MKRYAILRRGKPVESFEERTNAVGEGSPKGMVLTS